MYCKRLLQSLQRFLTPVRISCLLLRLIIFRKSAVLLLNARPAKPSALTLPVSLWGEQGTNTIIYYIFWIQWCSHIWACLISPHILQLRSIIIFKFINVFLYFAYKLPEFEYFKILIIFSCAQSNFVLKKILLKIIIYIFYMFFFILNNFF